MESIEQDFSAKALYLAELKNVHNLVPRPSFGRRGDEALGTRFERTLFTSNDRPCTNLAVPDSLSCSYVILHLTRKVVRITSPCAVLAPIQTSRCFVRLVIHGLKIRQNYHNLASKVCGGSELH